MLFSLSKEHIDAMATRMAVYTAKVPEPLNRKFAEKNSREEVIAKWNARKTMQTELFPPCKMSLQLLIALWMLDISYKMFV